MITGCRCQPIVEILKNEPIVHPMVRIHLDVLLKPLPSFGNVLIWRCWKLKIVPRRAFILPIGKNFCEEWIGAIVPCVYQTFVGIKPLFHSPQKREQKQSELNHILRDSLDHKSTAGLQELLEMSASILISLVICWRSLITISKCQLDQKIMRVCISYTQLYSNKPLNHTSSLEICKMCFWANMQVASTLWLYRKSQKMSERRFMINSTKCSPRTEANPLRIVHTSMFR